MVAGILNETAVPRKIYFSEKAQGPVEQSRQASESKGNNMETNLKWRNMTSIYLMYDGKILLLFRQGSRVVQDVWIGAAGGHFEEYELNNPTACVLRELEEELSVTEDMLADLKLRYITLRRVGEEVRQNHYFFANLKGPLPEKISSNEGTLKWFSLEELSELKMPFSAKYMMEHYLSIGRFNDNLYGGISDGFQVIFTQMPADS